MISNEPSKPSGGTGIRMFSLSWILVAIASVTGSNVLVNSVYAQTEAPSTDTSKMFVGQISSTQRGADGNAEWLQSGIFVLRTNAAEDSELPRTHLMSRFEMVMPDGNAMHSHKVYNFAVNSYTVEEDGMTHNLTGMATVTMRDGPVSEVPVSLIVNNSAIEMRIGPEKIDSHFGTDPVHGIVYPAAGQIPVAQSELETNMVNYYENVDGYLAYPKGSEDSKLPGVVMIHENRGLNEHIKNMAEQLAKEGYAVLAVDLFDGKVASESITPQSLTAPVRENPEIAIANLNAAVSYLSSLENVDSSRMASIGWCFGGGFSLQLALNAERPLAATVIYYGSLVTDEQELSAIHWPVLGIFGSEDQSITVDTVNQFRSALDANSITNEIYIYEGVGHAFANPSNANHAPDETKDAWQKTLHFLSEHV